MFMRTVILSASDEDARRISTDPSYQDYSGSFAE